MPEINDLRVYYIPQIPMRGFEYDVPDLKSAVMVLDALSRFSLFEFENRVKPDYSDAGGVQRYEDDGEGGHDWFDVDDDELQNLDCDCCA